MSIIQVRNLSKIFNLDHKRHLKFAPDRGRHTVLDNISFDIRKGECVGIIGRNGSGKTTLLRLIADILAPDGGMIKTKGRILPLIDLQTGINDELSGRENLFLKAMIHGLTKNEIQKKLSRIITFSGLEEFIDVKVKQYSAGMKMRLAFSMIMEVPHDILLIDEIIAVGDEEFKNKCRERFRTFRLQGKTIIIVSHNMEDLIKECDRVIFLDKGKIVADGPPAETVQVYLDLMIKHHLHDMRQNILQKLEELESLKPKENIDSQEGSKGTVQVMSRVLNRWRRKVQPEACYEDNLAELKSLMEEFGSLIEAKMEYLEDELMRLQTLAHKQRQYTASITPELLPKEDYVSELSEREDEFRQMLDEKLFLVEVKIRLGYTGTRVMHDHNVLGGRLQVLLNEYSISKAGSNLREMHLKLLKSELAKHHPVEMLVPSLNDYAGTCHEILKSESNRQTRTRVLEEFLPLIEQKVSEAADNGQLWVIERLLETSSAVFRSNSFLPEEGRFLPRYVSIFREALLKVSDQSASRRRIEELAHILRENVNSVESEHLNLSLQVESEPKSKVARKKLAELAKVKRLLLTTLSGLYTPFRATPTEEGWGFGDVEISKVSFPSPYADGAFRTGEQFTASIHYLVRKELKEGIRMGFTIHHKDGLTLFSPSTTITDKEKLKPGVENSVRFSLDSLPLLCGVYPVSVGIYDLRVTQPYDHRHQAYEMRVVTEGQSSEQGILELDHRWHTTLERRAHLRT